jgi:hypothetical protein
VPFPAASPAFAASVRTRAALAACGSSPADAAAAAAELAPPTGKSLAGSGGGHASKSRRPALAAAAVATTGKAAEAGPSARQCGDGGSGRIKGSAAAIPPVRRSRRQSVAAAALLRGGAEQGASDGVRNNKGRRQTSVGGQAATSPAGKPGPRKTETAEKPDLPSVTEGEEGAAQLPWAGAGDGLDNQAAAVAQEPITDAEEIVEELPSGSGQQAGLGGNGQQRLQAKAGCLSQWDAHPVQKRLTRRQTLAAAAVVQPLMPEQDMSHASATAELSKCRDVASAGAERARRTRRQTMTAAGAAPVSMPDVYAVCASIAGKEPAVNRDPAAAVPAKRTRRQTMAAGAYPAGMGRSLPLRQKKVPRSSGAAASILALQPLPKDEAENLPPAAAVEVPAAPGLAGAGEAAAGGGCPEAAPPMGRKRRSGVPACSLALPANTGKRPRAVAPVLAPLMEDAEAEEIINLATDSMGEVQAPGAAAAPQERAEAPEQEAAWQLPHPAETAGQAADAARQHAASGLGTGSATEAAAGSSQSSDTAAAAEPGLIQEPASQTVSTKEATHNLPRQAFMLQTW